MKATKNNSTIAEWGGKTRHEKVYYLLGDLIKRIGSVVFGSVAMDIEVSQTRHGINKLIDESIAQALHRQREELLDSLNNEIEAMKFIYAHQLIGKGNVRVCEMCREVVKDGDPCQASAFYPVWLQFQQLQDKITALRSLEEEI